MKVKKKEDELFDKKGKTFLQRFIKEPTWVKDIRKKGFKKALLEEIKSKELRQTLILLVSVAFLAFILGARADCIKDDGLFAFTSRWGIDWECYNRSQLENIPVYDPFPELAELNITLIEGNLSKNG